MITEYPTPPPDPSTDSTQPTQLRTLEAWQPAVFYRESFTAEECARVAALFVESRAGKAAGQIDRSVRDSLIQPLHPSAETQWLFEALGQKIDVLNRKHYGFELAGFTEPMQLARYGPGQFYDWHVDIGSRRNSTRKISFIVQLMGEADYEGGEVQIQAGHKPATLPKPRGGMALFPSYVLHRVAPVTRGERLSLVGWIGGHHYR